MLPSFSSRSTSTMALPIGARALPSLPDAIATAWSSFPSASDVISLFPYQPVVKLAELSPVAELADLAPVAELADLSPVA